MFIYAKNTTECRYEFVNVDAVSHFYYNANEDCYVLYFPEGYNFEYEVGNYIHKSNAYLDKWLRFSYAYMQQLTDASNANLH